MNYDWILEYKFILMSGVAMEMKIMVVAVEEGVDE